MRVAFMLWSGLASRWRSALVVFLRRYELCHHSKGPLCRAEVRHSVSLELEESVVHVLDLPRHMLALGVPWCWLLWRSPCLGALLMELVGGTWLLTGTGSMPSSRARLSLVCTIWISAVFAELGSFCVDGCPHISASQCFCVIGMLDSGSVHLEHRFELFVLFSCRLSDVSAIDGAEVFFFAHDTASALASVPSSVDVSNKTLVAFAEIRLVIPLTALSKTVRAAWKSDVTCITCGNASAAGCPKSSTSWSFSQSNLPKNASQTASHASRVPPKLSPTWMARSF